MKIIVKFLKSQIHIVLPTIFLGFLVGLYFADRPPLDWEKWSVWGQWAGVLATVFVGIVGYTLPRRFAEQDRLKRMRFRALAIMGELKSNIVRMQELANWLDKLNPGPRPEHLTADKNCWDHHAQYIEEDNPAIAHDLRNVYELFDKVTFASTIVNAVGHLAPAENPNALHDKGLIGMAAKAHFRAIEAYDALATEYHSAPLSRWYGTSTMPAKLIRSDFSNS